MVEYDWDPAKEAENVRRHGVNFEMAMYALRDPFRMKRFDEVPQRMSLASSPSVATSEGGFSPW